MHRFRARMRGSGCIHNSKYLSFVDLSPEVLHALRMALSVDC